MAKLQKFFKWPITVSITQVITSSYVTNYQYSIFYLYKYTYAIVSCEVNNQRNAENLVPWKNNRDSDNRISY